MWKQGMLTTAPYEKGVEAYYRQDISKHLALTALDACKDLFIGKSVNSETSGFSYSDLLVENGDSALSSSIINEIEQAHYAINNLEDNFRLQITKAYGVEDMRATYDQLQDVVPLLKVGMLAVLDFDPDYNDTDGD